MDNPVRPPATPPSKTYILPKPSPCSLNLQVELTSLTSLASVTTSTLLDSRATGMFINWDFMGRHLLETTPLPQPVLLCNIDGSANEHGSIMEEVHPPPLQTALGKSPVCCHQPRATVSDHPTPLVIASQSRGRLGHPEGLDDLLSH